jgi:hypothetical protein
MGFVVYNKRKLELRRYYDTAAKAQAQVTQNNRKAIIAVLKGDEYVNEWDYVSWAEFENIFKIEYNNNKWAYLNRS